MAAKHTAVDYYFSTICFNYSVLILNPVSVHRVMIEKKGGGGDGGGFQLMPLVFCFIVPAFLFLTMFKCFALLCFATLCRQICRCLVYREIR